MTGIMPRNLTVMRKGALPLQSGCIAIKISEIGGRKPIKTALAA